MREIVSENRKERILLRFKDSACRYAHLLNGDYWPVTSDKCDTHYIVEYPNSGELAKFITENALSYLGESAFVAFSSEISLAEFSLVSEDYEGDFEFAMVSNVKRIISELKYIFDIDFTYNIIKKSIVFCVDLDVVSVEDFMRLFNSIKKNGPDYIKRIVWDIVHLIIVESEMVNQNKSEGEERYLYIPLGYGIVRAEEIIDNLISISPISNIVNWELVFRNFLDTIPYGRYSADVFFEELWNNCFDILSESININNNKEAIEYLVENDYSLEDSIRIARDLGYELKDINATVLANLLATDIEAAELERIISIVRNDMQPDVVYFLPDVVGGGDIEEQNECEAKVYDTWINKSHEGEEYENWSYFKIKFVND